MRKTVILGLLVLLVGLAMPTASAQPSEFYLIPDNTSGGLFCNNTTVEIWINATVNVIGTKATIQIDDPSCGNIVAVAGGTGWHSTTSVHVNHGLMRVLSLNYGGLERTGHLHVGSLTIHCNDSCNCTTDVSFVDVSDPDETYAWNASAEMVPTTWDDGTFTCGENAPNLIVESVELNPSYGSSYDDYYFANESNTVNITIKNVGTVAAGASDTRVSGASGDSVTAAVGILAPGASQTVTVVDTATRPAGEVVNAVADCGNAVTECDETDNTYEISSDDSTHDYPGTVINHGNKGKRWTGGSDLTTWDTFNCNLVYSVGDSSYVSGGSYWTMIDVAWTAVELPIPDGAAITEARLYVPYTWDAHDVMPDGVSMSFNGVNQDPADAHYADRKGFGTEYPYGMLAYNVTGDFDSSGNYANLSKAVAGDKVSIRGMVLMVVYEGECGRERLIFVNEEFDYLHAGVSYGTPTGVSQTEATAWAPLTGAAINVADISSAKLITFAPGAGGTTDEGHLIFKNAAGETTWNDVWNYAGSSQIGIDERDVTALLTATGNEVGFQSDGDGSDWMEASNVVLIVTYKDGASECLGTCYDDASCTVSGVPGTTCAACIAAGKYWHPNLDSDCFDGNTPADMCINWCPECSDGVDNTDPDTLVDFPADPECTCGLDPSEDEPACPIPELATFTMIGIGLMMFAGVALRRKE